MNKTVMIDDDVLAAAEELAEIQKRSLGEVLSNLARSALSSIPQARTVRNGILLLPVQRGSRPVTSELVKQLDEETP